MTNNGSFCIKTSVVFVLYNFAENTLPFTRIVILYISEISSAPDISPSAGGLLGSTDGSISGVSDGNGITDVDGVTDGNVSGVSDRNGITDADGVTDGEGVTGTVGLTVGVETGNPVGGVSSFFLSDETTLIFIQLLYFFFFAFTVTVTFAVPTLFAVILPVLLTDTIRGLLEWNLIL